MLIKEVERVVIVDVLERLKQYTLSEMQVPIMKNSGVRVDSRKSIDRRKQDIEVSIDRRKIIKRRLSEQRLEFERRLQQLQILFDRRLGKDRRADE